MSDRTVGLLGYGKIGTYLRERIAETPGIDVAFVHSRSSVDLAADGPDVIDAGEIADRDVDLVVEAATADAVAALGPSVLDETDLLALSTTALADRELHATLANRCEAAGTRLYVPHGAVLGTDGLRDGRDAIDRVRIETRKPPANLDFSDAEEHDRERIDGETVLYDGPTRGICREFPRNVNSHATVALAGVGFDDTRSTLIADPSATTATHRITAEGEGTTLEIERSSAIEGVTGDYTLRSVWGSVRHLLVESRGITVV